MSITWTIVDHAGWSALAHVGIHDMRDCTATTAGITVSESNFRTTRRIDVPPVDSAFYLKRFVYSGARQRNRFRRDHATVEAANYAVLRNVCRLPTPDVIAFGSRRGGARLLDAVLITRGVHGAVTLDAFQATHLEQPIILSQLAKMVARMHSCHFHHCDLEWRNILVRRAVNAIELFLIDSSRGGLRRTALLRRHGRIRDLYSLDRVARRRLSRPQRLRWLRHYLSACTGLPAINERSLLKSMFRYSARKD